MKHVKRAFALILTLAIVMSLGITAFAETVPTGTLKIENTTAEKDYSVYRIFDLVLNGDSYAYKLNEKWDDFVATVTYKVPAEGDPETINDNALVRVGLDGYYHACDKNGAYKPADDASWAVLFGNKVSDWLKAHSIAAEETIKASGSSVTSKALPYGYYYVSTTTGTVVTLDSLDGSSVTISDKNVAPTLSKVIVGASGDVSANTAAVGDTVNFKMNLTITEGTKNHVVHDVLSKGLTRNDDVAVKVTRSGASASSDLTANTHFKVAAAKDTPTGVTQFNITFLDDAKLAKGDVLEITYSAVVNKDALLHTGSDNTMTNTATLWYSTPADTGDTAHDPASADVPKTLSKKTPEEKTVTYNFNVVVLKFTGDINDATRLAGAKFKLRSAVDGVAGFAFAATSTKGEYDLVGAKAADVDVTELVTGDDGILSLNGLNAGTYFLEETVAPTGYNKPADRFKIVITAASPTTEGSGVKVSPSDSVNIKVPAVELASDVVAIQNNVGQKLPSTGGVGTTIFYVAGAALMVGALVLLITKKKMSAN